MAEEFVWKSDGKIFKGVGIYHLTFRVASDRLRLGKVVGRTREEIAAAVQPLLAAGEACDASNPRYVEAVKGMARVELTPFGKAVERDLGDFGRHHPGVQVCQKIVMDSHVHLVVWVQKDCGRSIREMAQGFRTGITRVAREMGVWPIEAEGEKRAERGGEAGGARETGATRPENRNANAECSQQGWKGEGAIEATGAREAAMRAAVDAEVAGVGMGAVCSAGPYHVFDKPFIRTLARRGQLRSMIDYVQLNAYRRWVLVLYPELFRLHRDTKVRGLHFRSLGNHWLLDWPERQVVQCSRSIGEEELERQMREVLQRAEQGAITYTAAISKGEQRIARAVREAGWPLVVLLMDGFPPAGSESERYYKPGGVYFDACKAGKLLLLEASHETYEKPELVRRTDEAIKAKDEAKGYAYRPMTHEKKRWRMMAGNVMLEMIADADGSNLGKEENDTVIAHLLYRPLK